MPILAGWLTGEQVSPEIIEQTLLTMGQVLGRYGGQPARTVQPGAGLIAFADPAYAMSANTDPPALDWISERRTMVYRRPLSGAHALYFIENWPAEGNLLFASEIKALFAVGVARRLHLPALDALLRYGFIPAPWTIFKDIQIVPAGSILRWQRAKTVLNFATDYHIDDPLSPIPSLDQLETLLHEASANLLPSHEQLLAITGGSPASTLATLLTAQHTSVPFPIASLGYTKSGRARAWDGVQRIATACERPLLAITSVDQPEFWTATIAGLEAPTTDTRSLALHQLLHTASTETEARVAISGLGAHVLTGSLMKQPSNTDSTETTDLLSIYRSILIAQPTHKLWSAAAAQALQESSPWEETLHARKLARHASQFPNQQQGFYYLDLHLRLPDFIVHPTQQLATQEHMTVRSPYLTSQVMDLLSRLPETEFSKEQCLTTILQQHIPETGQRPAKLPLSAPATSLFQLANSELLQQVLSPESLQATGIFDLAVVESLLKQAQRKTPPRELLLILTTQLLYQLFEVNGW